MRFLILTFLLASTLTAADFDLLIRDARVVDGTGNPWFLADVGVNDGKIASIGNLDGKTADSVIDAARRVLTPGFIDVHAHIEKRPYRPGITDYPDAFNYTMDGKTTMITGNCGSSKVDLDGWFAALERSGLGPNLMTLVGHNSVRREVMGDSKRAATPEELRRMQDLVAKAMKAGAAGLSTGLIYIPGTYADTDEVVALAKVAGKHGGVYATHMRNEGAEVLAAIREAVYIGEQAGTPVQISHFKISNKHRWGNSDKSIELVEEYRRKGIDVVVDQYPYDRSSTGVSTALPTWALADGQEAIRARLRDPETRAKVIEGMKEILDKKGFGDYSYAMVASCDWEPELAGKTISEVNVMRGREATVDNEIETILELVEKGSVPMVFHSMSDEDVERIMRYRNTAISSDGYILEFGKGVPHPRSYGTYARAFAEYVRKRKVLTLEDAVRKATSLPARTFGLKDRGLVREGFAADLVIFDPDLVQDNATFQEPHQYSTGFDYVIVNGVPIVADGKRTGKRPGRILRHGS
ncbi:MAG: D-aminoacylase [Gammaproteobacteria bacterium]|nr:D-aminoacylase [Gammaproteobacteria bacterium]